MSGNSKVNSYTAVEEWEPTAFRPIFIKPRAGDTVSGYKIRYLNSTIPGKKRIELVFPEMTTWGITQSEDPKSKTPLDKFTLSLQFPDGEYRTPQLDTALAKLIQFENAVIDLVIREAKQFFPSEYNYDDADEVANYMPKNIKKNFNSALKYPKIKGPDGKSTDQPDKSKMPYLKIKVPYYDGVFNGIRVFNDKLEMIFPDTENPDVLPMECVEKLDKVKSAIYCAGIWSVGDKWGVQWKMDFVVVSSKGNMTMEQVDPHDIFGISFTTNKETPTELIENMEDDGISHIPPTPQQTETLSSTAETIPMEIVEPPSVPMETVEPTPVETKKTPKKIIKKPTK